MKGMKPRGHQNSVSPWAPIGPFRVWLRQEAEKLGSTNKLCDELGVHYKQMLRWLKINKWVPIVVVDEAMMKRGQMYTDIYDHDDLVSSATARGIGQKEVT